MMGRPEYPKDMPEFRRRFSTPEACREYPVQCRWPEGFMCPKCFGRKAWLNSRRYVFECQECGRQTAPTFRFRNGFGRSDTHAWNQCPATSATTWNRRLSECMARSAPSSQGDGSRCQVSPLGSGRSRRNIRRRTHKRQTGPRRASNCKSLVVGAVEILAYNDTDGKRKERAGRLRLALIPDASEESLGSFLKRKDDPGS